ncbi:hypothetical protein OH77DRAFT_1440844, partial [Trametes cingulata]
VDSLKKSASEDFVDLKRKVSALILQKLPTEGACTRANISKMFYVNFTERIAARYGIVVEHWPLPKFTAPGNLGSRAELLVLHQAFENDVARFRQLTNEEWEDWLKAYREGGEEAAPISYSFVVFSPSAPRRSLLKRYLIME